MGLNAIEFAKRFKTNEDCLLYLIEMKWGKGYECVKCQAKQYGKGRTYYYRRCKGCGYDESVLANTVFHDMRVPLLKAFHMAFRIVSKKKGMSSVELANEVGVQQKTAWLFKRKMQAVMQHYDREKLKDEVISDETLMGGSRRGSYGRKHKQKAIVFVAIEKLDNGHTGNISLQPINNFKLVDVLPVVKQNIEEQATLYMDDYPTNRGVKKRRNNTKIVRSKGSDFFEEMHKQIMMFKMWLTGIHHKCSKQHLGAYTAEYEFRFNRRNQREWLFHNMLQGVLALMPQPYSILKAN